MMLVDNHANGRVRSLVEQALQEMQKSYRVIENDTNVGFAAGHNQAMKQSAAAYALLLNPDMYLLPNVLETLVSLLDRHADIVSVAPRLMRWNFSSVPEIGNDLFSRASVGFTDQVDAIGIRLFHNRRAVEWLAQQQWSKENSNADVRRLYGKEIVEVFGVSGALAMYRRSALQKVLFEDGNMFDPTYHSYKEDLDLAYRLRDLGHTAYVVLDAVAYHDRTSAAPMNISDWAAIKNKKKQSQYVRFHSYKNHLRTLYKNEYWQNFLLDLPFIAWYELKKFVFLLCTSPSLLFRAWYEVFRHIRYTKHARRFVKKNRTMYWKGLRRWF